MNILYSFTFDRECSMFELKTVSRLNIILSLLACSIVGIPNLGVTNDNVRQTPLWQGQLVQNHFRVIRFLKKKRRWIWVHETKNQKNGIGDHVPYYYCISKIASCITLVFTETGTDKTLRNSRFSVCYFLGNWNISNRNPSLF